MDEDLKSTTGLIKIAGIAGLIYVAIFVLGYLNTFLGLNLPILPKVGIMNLILDGYLILVLTIGIFLKSRTCAILLFTYYAFSVLSQWFTTIKETGFFKLIFTGLSEMIKQNSIVNVLLHDVLIPIVFLIAFFQGVIGTFQYHKLIKQKNLQAKPIYVLVLVLSLLFVPFLLPKLITHKDGIHKKFYKSGALKEESTYSNNKANGPYKAYYQSGKLHQEGFYKNNEPEGEYKEYFENGNARQEIFYKDGLPQGVVKQYYETGELYAEVQLKNGKPDGYATEYYKSGKVKSVVTNANGKRNGVTKAYYEDGELLAEESFVDGKPDKEFKKYYEDGMLSAYGRFDNGKKLELVEYDRNGKIIKQN